MTASSLTILTMIPMIIMKVINMTLTMMLLILMMIDGADTSPNYLKLIIIERAK